MIHVESHQMLTQAARALACGAETGWCAELDLAFRRQQTRTVLARREHRGPLMVQRPFHPDADGGACHVYVLHPPGGLVGGDRLAMAVTLDARSHALITTPAAGKVYRCEQAPARQQVSASVAAHAHLDWLPQETIFYDGARADFVTRIDVAAGGSCVVWEIGAFGRALAAAPFAHGLCSQRLEFWRGDVPLLLERLRVDVQVLHAGWGLRGHAVSGTLVAVSADMRACTDARDCIAAHARQSATDPLAGIASVTLLGDVLVCRALAHGAQWVRQLFATLWLRLRPLLAGTPSALPRVWAT